MNEKRLEILHRVESGEMSIEYGAQMLESLERDESFDISKPLAIEGASQSAMAVASPEPVPPVEVIVPPFAGMDDELPVEYDARIAYWKRWWLLPFGIGILIMVLGAYWMYLGYMAAGLSWGFWLSWIPFGLGVLITAASARSRTARWLHVRVHQRPGQKPENINISMPLPLHFTAWFLHTFGRWMPAETRDNHLDEALEMLDAAISSDAPLHIQVDENDEQVEVYIG
jgi:hypothetical protein